MYESKRSVLFVSVHPDDETLGCGGSIIKHKQTGDSIYWLNLTGPTPNHPYGFSETMIQDRNALVDLINNEYGFSGFFNLNFPTQMLDTINSNVLIGDIDKVICDIKPSVVYLPNRTDVHSDHRVAFNAIYACTKNFRKPFIKKILMYETLSETEFAPAIADSAFIANYFVDISEYLDRKIEIYSFYKTEIMPDPYPRSFSAVKALAAFRGSRIGVEYAEAFNCLLSIN